MRNSRTVSHSQCPSMWKSHHQLNTFIPTHLKTAEDSRIGDEVSMVQTTQRRLGSRFRKYHTLTLTLRKNSQETYRVLRTCCSSMDSFPKFSILLKRKSWPALCCRPHRHEGSRAGWGHLWLQLFQEWVLYEVGVVLTFGIEFTSQIDLSTEGGISMDEKPFY